MPPPTVAITGFVAGDAMTIKRPAITGVPQGRTLTKAWLTIKRNKRDADNQAALQLSITSSPAAAGQITDTGASGTAALLFALTNAQTLALGWVEPYVFDIQLKFDNGDIATLELGTIQFTQGVTDAAS